jgi:hypothetical protein
LAVGKGENQASDNPNKKEFLKRDVTFSAEKNLVPGGSQTVKGFEMEDVKMSSFSSAPLPWQYILSFLIFFIPRLPWLEKVRTGKIKTYSSLKYHYFYLDRLKIYALILMVKKITIYREVVVRKKQSFMGLVTLLSIASLSFAQEGKEVKLEDVGVTASRVEEKPENAMPFVQVIKTTQATGTGTDNIIAVTGTNGPRVSYTGGHSKIVELIGKAVYEGVVDALKKQNGFEMLKPK